MIVLYLAEDLGVMEKLPVEVSSKVCCMHLGEVTMSTSSAYVISVQNTSSCQVLCEKKEYSNSVIYKIFQFLKPSAV